MLIELAVQRQMYLSRYGKLYQLQLSGRTFYSKLYTSHLPFSFILQQDGSSHFRRIKHSTTNDLRQSWRTIWMKKCVNGNTSEDYESILQFYDIWKALVAVNTTVPFSATRDFVSPSLVMIDDISPETDLSIKWKQLDILNEILCYGSTLGIQSDIPVEASEVAQRLLRRAQSDNYFDEFHVPKSPAGMGGNSKIICSPEDITISMPILQKVVMLYLKAVAVVVREAQAIGSSDESASDSSLSSR